MGQDVWYIVVSCVHCVDHFSIAFALGRPSIDTLDRFCCGYSEYQPRLACLHLVFYKKTIGGRASILFAAGLTDHSARLTVATAQPLLRLHVLYTVPLHVAT